MEILRAIERLSHIGNALLDDKFAQFSIGDAEAHVLMELEGSGRDSIASIQRAFHFKPSTLTGILDRLEGRGILRRELNPEDRRSLLVVLTDDGKAIATAVVELLDQVEARIRERTQAADIEGFLRVAEAISAVALEPEQ